jgi:hypothetical protein
VSHLARWSALSPLDREVHLLVSQGPPGGLTAHCGHLLTPEYPTLRPAATRLVVRELPTDFVAEFTATPRISAVAEERTAALCDYFRTYC